MRTEIIIDYDAGESTVATELFCALIDRVVNLKLSSDGFPTENVYVLRVDPDGDVVVCELDEQGAPIENVTDAIPQDCIERVMIATGNYA
jgi:hypothetical protein